MTRALLVGFFAFAAACGGDKTFDSLCLKSPAPAACSLTCDPTATASSCPSGFHCASAGKCDEFCTQGGTECGTGFTCSSTGQCIASGSTGGDVDAGGTVGGSDPDAACPDLHFTTTKVTPSIELLIDISGSMLAGFDNNTKNPISSTNPQKFATEVDALVGTKGIVTQLQGSVLFGASLYPGSNACPVQLLTVDRALNNKTSIATLLNRQPAGSTPTSDSLDLVVKQFHDKPAPMGSPPAIVLATDGLPNACGSNNTGVDVAAEMATVNSATAAFKAGIPVFLLAVGTAIDPTFAQQVANAGQGAATGAKTQFFTATDPDSLANAFSTIIKGVVSCNLTLNGMVEQDNAASGVVTLNGTMLTYMTDWTLDSTGTVIQLQGTACTTLKDSAAPVVNATFPCGGGIIF
jgi:hypothetical protein